MTDDESLVIEFCGEERILDSDDSLTFGRRGDLLIDDNPYLHRIVGRFVWRQGLWWLQNQGSKIGIEVRDRCTSSRLSVAAGQQAAIVPLEFTVGFTAGPTSYELRGRRHGGPVDGDDALLTGGTATIDFGIVPLSAEQHLLLVALCEARLLVGSETLPTNQAVATRLGWTITKFNRKLDHLCAKLSREGVRGLRGGPDGLAMDRRQVLVDHAIDVRLVTAADLGLLV